MATCRKKAALARNRPSITSAHEEDVLRVNSKAMQEGNSDALSNAIPGFGVEPAKVEVKADKKSVKKQEQKTTKKEGDKNGR